MTTPKNHAENSRREAILTASLPLFLANGYEKTSMRMIANKVGCEVGLVYYYFSTKDDVFEHALALYFENHRQAIAAITEANKKDASRYLEALIAYFEKEAPSFAATFHNSVHWTIRYAVRAKCSDLLLPYMTEVVTLLSRESRMPYPVDTAAKIASDILVNTALDSEGKDFTHSKDDVIRILSHVLGTERSVGRRRDIPSFLL